MISARRVDIQKHKCNQDIESSSKRIGPVDVITSMVSAENGLRRGARARGGPRSCSIPQKNHNKKKSTNFSHNSSTIQICANIKVAAN